MIHHYSHDHLNHDRNQPSLINDYPSIVTQVLTNYSQLLSNH